LSRRKAERFPRTRFFLTHVPSMSYFIYRMARQEREEGSLDSRYSSPAVREASRVLFCLAAARSSHMSLMEICAELAIPKSRAFSVLKALEEFGLVERNRAGKGYSLGPGLITLSRKVLDNLNLPHLAEPILENLASKTGNTALLGLITGDDTIIAAKRDGEGTISVTTRIGFRRPLTYGAHGKAIVAFLPEEERDRILKKKHVYFTGDSGKPDMELLKKQLAQCRKYGFAEDLGETNPGLNVIAAPILGPAGTPVGYLELLVLFSADLAHDFGPLVASGAITISRQLGADVDKLYA
jgi:DNA-binding IclR family transcriptional regulator